MTKTSRVTTAELLELEPVPGLVEHVTVADRTEELFGQSVTVNAGWWNRELAALGLPGSVEAVADGERVVDGRGTITRADLFDLAGTALADDADDAATLSLLWRASAWGAGTSGRNMRRRMKSVRQDPAGFAALLREAGVVGRTDPRAAYELLYPRRRTAIRFLGPAFFTKFLYFAGAGAPDHPSLILDARVAAALNTSIDRRGLRYGGWKSETYQGYCLLLERWAREHGVRADVIEHRLFALGGQ